MYLFTITDAHLRRAHVTTAGPASSRIDREVVQAKQALGQILAGDVGKRVFLCLGVVQVESDQQRAARLAAPRKKLSIVSTMG